MRPSPLLQLRTTCKDSRHARRFGGCNRSVRGLTRPVSLPGAFPRGAIRRAIGWSGHLPYRIVPRDTKDFPAHGPKRRTQEDCPYRLRHDWRHARPSRREEGNGRHRPVRHCRGHAAGQGARPVAVRPCRRLRREDHRHERLCRHRRCRRRDRDRRRAAQARHEPRRPARHQSVGDESRRRRHQEQRARRVRHLHHQPTGRDGLGAARVFRPAAQQGGRHGRRARQRALRNLPRLGIRLLGEGRECLRAGRPRRHDGSGEKLHDDQRHSGR